MSICPVITKSHLSSTTRAELAAAFSRLHRPQDGDILILPNAWDALSARVIEHAGARAIATTSAGVSWTLGRPDGQAWLARR